MWFLGFCLVRFSMVLRGGAGGLLFFLRVEVVLPELSVPRGRTIAVIVMAAAAAISAAPAPPAAKASTAAPAPLMLLVHVPRRKGLKRRHPKSEVYKQIMIGTSKIQNRRLCLNYNTDKMQELPVSSTYQSRLSKTFRERSWMRRNSSPQTWNNKSTIKWQVREDLK